MEKQSLPKRLVWFIGLWFGGLLAVSAVALVIKLALAV